MRIQLVLLLLGASLHALAVSDKSMSELFIKYDQVMKQKKFELVEEVFSKKFLRASGGKEKFIKKLEGLPASKKGPGKEKEVSWKKGIRDEVYFVKNRADPSSEFIVIKEDGKLKIDGQVSDAE